MLLCRAQNDGEFVIPAQFIEALSFGNFASISLYSDIEVPLSIPEVGSKEVFWAVGSDTSLVIYHDPSAKPVIPTDCGPMELGRVGKACDDESTCGGGCCLTVPDYLINGYCSIPNCESDESCPSDSKCYTNSNPFIPYDSFCAKVCESNDDCREADGQLCDNIFRVCISGAL